MSKDLFLFSFSILLCWVDWYPLYCNQYLSYLSSQLSPVWFFLHTSICFFFPLLFCVCLALNFPAIHTYIHHTLMFPCCIHGWEKQSTHASSSFSFCVPRFVPCFSFLLPEQSFGERFDWLIFFLDSFFLSFFLFFVRFLEVWIERKTYSTVQ